MIHAHTPDTELSDIMDELARVYDLPFWLEEQTGRMPTDAELLTFRYVGDVLRWAGMEVVE